ncbi:PH domain-containing protein [Blastococcus litoris]|uniref:PH domain-containing protein n=1 Tax=Blastococcus litoris TaxID=2171622 RepID=UPI000E2FF4CA|nr:PH domain-containing protein [Blastococcus litoris]
MTPPLGGSAPAGRRTSPRIVLAHTATFRQARQFVPAVIPIVAATGLGGGTTTIVLLVIGVTLLSLATAALSWWRFTYADGPTAVVVTRGLLSRSVRTVPNDRIRGVEVEAGPLHRLLGLVRVRIDAAAGAAGKDEELLVDGVSRAEGDRLRASVLTHRSAPVVEEEAPEAEEVVVARFDNRWLLYAPLVGSYLAVPFAAVGALFRLAQELPERFRPDLDRVHVSGVQVLLLVLGAGVVVLVVGSVIGAAVVNWGFRLTRRGHSLVAARGLITRRHTELEIDRIRGWTLSEGLGMRWVRAARSGALVTGLGDAARRGQLLPLGPREEARALGVRLVPDPGPLLPHPPAARRRRVVRALAAGLLVTAAGAVVTPLLGWWWVLATGVVLVALGVPMGLGRYAALGHAAGGGSFAVRSGWLVREEAVLQRRAVVGWEVRQSPFQRRAGLATVTACVGAGRGGYVAIDMDAGEVPAFTAAASDRWAEDFSRPA